MLSGAQCPDGIYPVKLFSALDVFDIFSTGRTGIFAL
jgi:hypothetical protein